MARTAPKALTSYGYLSSGGTLVFAGKKEEDRNFIFLSNLVAADKKRRNIDESSKYSSPCDDYGVRFSYTDKTIYLRNGQTITKNDIFCKNVKIQYSSYFYHIQESDLYGVTLYVQSVTVLQS